MKRHNLLWTGAVCEDPSGKWVQYEDARAVIDGLQALLNERDADIDRLAALSVSHILLAVEPGPDGMGVEVYASSVAQVVEALDSACNWVEVLQGQVEELGGYHAIQRRAPQP